jgi:hypothetical protein
MHLNLVLGSLFESRKFYYSRSLQERICGGFGSVQGSGVFCWAAATAEGEAHLSVYVDTTGADVWVVEYAG